MLFPFVFAGTCPWGALALQIRPKILFYSPDNDGEIPPGTLCVSEEDDTSSTSAKLSHNCPILGSRGFPPREMGDPTNTGS